MGIEMSSKNKFYEAEICVNPINLWIKKICIPHLSLVLARAIINNHQALPNAVSCFRQCNTLKFFLNNLV
ncbi:MAG: hypothetical protein L3J74_07665 [Bacteroidales bacterium]|nr:hypothetical protein [Bacteroidales bacterium]